MECEQLSLEDLDQQLSCGALEEPLEEDFQRMLSEWETHISSLAPGQETEESSSQERVLASCSPPSPQPPPPAPRPVPCSGLRSPVLPRPGLPYTRGPCSGVTRIARPGQTSFLPLSPLRSPPRSPQRPVQVPPSCSWLYIEKLHDSLNVLLLHFRLPPAPPPPEPAPTLLLAGHNQVLILHLRSLLHAGTPEAANGVVGDEFPAGR